MLPTPSERLCILLVEDDEDTSSAMQDLLHLEGHDVIPVATVEHARRTLAGGIRPNIVILDELLPDGRGSDLIRELKAVPELGLIPFVLVTASSAPLELDDASVLVLRKPMDIETLLNAVKAMNGEADGRHCAAAH